VVGNDHCNHTGPLTVTVDWEPDPLIALRIEATVTLTDGQTPVVAEVMIDFGDGSAPVQALSGEPIGHTYLLVGTYTLTAWPLSDPGNTGEATVTISVVLPLVFAYSDPEDDWRALAWIDEPDDGTVYSVDWGDGTGGVLESGAGV
jgi:hypothetical protein